MGYSKKHGPQLEENAPLENCFTARINGSQLEK